MADGRRHPLFERNRAIVVGAGMGGLSCALSLALRGLEVTVVEAMDEPGGKMRPLFVGGAWVDSGPTVFTMRWVFEQLFEQAGVRFSDRVRCEPLSILARHAWKNHAPTLDLLADRRASIDAIGRFSGPGEARRFAAFCDEAARLYRHLEAPYIRAERPTVTSMVRDLGPRGLACLMSLGPFSSLWRALGRRFEDPRLRQLFGRYATYCGASPLQAPATLMLIAQVEMDGVWAVEGGMRSLARAVAQLATERGVSFRYGSPVHEVLVEGGKARGVRLASGETLSANTVVFNGDCNALATESVAGARPAGPGTPDSQRSLSAVTWSLNAPTDGFDLVRHNVFFDQDYRSEFDDIFGHSRLPTRPTVYLCAQDRQDRGLSTGANETPLSSIAVANSRRERMLILVNAPAIGDRGSEHEAETAREIASCEQRTFELMQHCGLTINRSSPPTTEPDGSPREIRSTPWTFHQRFPATGGSLYGRATHGWMSAFSRQGARTGIPGLYLVGGSVHPGPGVPMATMSGRLAAETVMEHLDSTSRSGRVVIAGGISTPSAMTGSMA